MKKVSMFCGKKKGLIISLSLLFVFAALLTSCGKNSGDNNNQNQNSVIHNIVDGRILSFAPESNWANVSSDAEGLILVSGETYSFKAYVELENGTVDTSYDCSGTIWQIEGNIGYFASAGVTSPIGETISLKITAQPNTIGRLKLESGSMKFYFPVKIAASIGE
jgi:hypothetical protein